MLLAYGASIPHKPYKREEDNTSIDEYKYSITVDENYARRIGIGRENEFFVFPKGTYQIVKVILVWQG